jgi:hypothetical protein
MIVNLVINEYRLISLGCNMPECPIISFTQLHCLTYDHPPPPATEGSWYCLVTWVKPTCYTQAVQGSNFIAAIALEGEQNAVDHCGNDGNFLPYSAIFILFTVHYYFDTWIQMLIKSCVNHYFSLSFLRKKTLKKYVDMFLACQKSKVTIKLKFYYSNLENAVETAKIAVDSCYVLRQFLTPLPSIDFREIRGLRQSCDTVGTVWAAQWFCDCGAGVQSSI